MDVDWPDPKRRRLDDLDAWWEDSALWGLCDALMLYANGPAGCSVSSGQWWSTVAPGSPGRSSMDLGAINEDFSTACEPLLRALTQLANAAAAGAVARRQLVAECHVQAPLLRLMQTPWAQQPLVMERCCRLLHWLCARAPENREMLAAHHSPCLKNGARSVSFVDVVLGAVEAHACCREVLAHAFRALVALLPSLRVREELLRAQQRLLSCLTLASEALDTAVVRAVCRWLPGVSSQVRRARGRPRNDRDSIMGVSSSSQADGYYMSSAEVTGDCSARSAMLTNTESSLCAPTEVVWAISAACDDLDVEMADMTDDL